MSRHLNLLPAAAADLAEARDWYDERREGLGREFIGEVDDALRLILENPEWHPAEFQSIRRAQVRRFPYIVYCRIQREHLEVLAILHSKRNPRVWRSRA